MTLSVIIPIYNVEAYLERCFASVSKQTYNDYELLLINDGSTDESLSLCMTYANTNNRVRVIDKPHSTVGSTRNLGLTEAQGKYILLLDSDDYFAPTMFETMVSYAEKLNADVVECNYLYDYPQFFLLNQPSYLGKETHKQLPKEQVMQCLISGDMQNFLWNRLYKASLIKRHISFKNMIFSDFEWQHRCLQDAENYVVINNPLYYYCVRPNSNTGSLSVKIIDLFRAYETRMAFVQEHYAHLMPVIVRHYWKTVYENGYHIMRIGSTEMKERYAEYWQYMLKTYADLLRKHVPAFGFQLTLRRIGLDKVLFFAKRVMARIKGSKLKTIPKNTAEAQCYEITF